MGDFEDIFGAGVDVVDIINGISADERHFTAREDQLKHQQEVIDHRLWFPDYSAAERWEKFHPGVAFTRRRRQGGFEITLRDRRSAAETWRRSVIPPEEDIAGNQKPVTLVHAEGLEDHVVRHGSYSVSLAKETASMLVQFLALLRNQVPAGLAALDPIIIERTQFHSLFRAMPRALSHELEMGMGVMAVFCEDHHLLVGRRIGKDEIRLWPWLLEMNCGGGECRADGVEGCFLCNHHDLHDAFIRSNTHYDREAFNYPAPESHRHFIEKESYAGRARPRDLARCVKDWISLLSPLDQRMDASRRAPSSVIAVRKNPSASTPPMDAMCDVLACAIAVLEDIDEQVTVFLDATTDFESLTQARSDRLTLSWEISAHGGDAAFNGRREDRPAVPDIATIDFAKSLPDWYDFVDLYPTEQGPRQVTRTGGNNVARGSYCAEKLSAHEKEKAAEVLKRLIRSDLSPLVREFIENEPPRVYPQIRIPKRTL